MARDAGETGCDALVVGAGLAGLVTALGLAEAGANVVLCGEPERGGAGRTVALFDGSIRFIKSLGAWEAIMPAAAPLRALRLIDDTGSIWSPPPVEFHASEIGLDAFGWNVENARLADALWRRARETGLAVVESRVSDYVFGPDGVRAHCENGVVIEAKLVAGADGRDSPVRRAAKIVVANRRRPQTALTAILTHKLPHNDFSTEFQTRQGAFTLVPLPDSPSGSPRSSLVWMMSHEEARRRAALDDDALAREIESAARSFLGAMAIEGARGAFPIVTRSAATMIGPRLALVGDAAHVFPPIGAQGLNLGLRDAAHLVETVAQARREGRDIGAPETLRRYANARRFDVALRMGAVGALNDSLIAAVPPVDFLRGVGLAALGAIGPLRRLAMREGVSPRFWTPGSMRA